MEEGREMREREHEKGYQGPPVGQRTDPKHLAPSSLSCAMSLLVSTSTRGWAGVQRGGDNQFHPPEVSWRLDHLTLKSGQSMCKGAAEVLVQAGRDRMTMCRAEYRGARRPAPDTCPDPTLRVPLRWLAVEKCQGLRQAFP